MPRGAQSFHPRFDLSAARIVALAAKYSDQQETLIESEVSPRARARGHLTKSEFLLLCKWKYGGRAISRAARNDENYIRVVTSASFSSGNERFRIESLRMLDGVDWPTASAILCWCSHDQGGFRYPILDQRALWSLEVPWKVGECYDFEFWWSYVEFCRMAAERARIDLRMLDRALWQFSKDNS